MASPFPSLQCRSAYKRRPAAPQLSRHRVARSSRDRKTSAQSECAACRSASDRLRRCPCRAPGGLLPCGEWAGRPILLGCSRSELLPSCFSCAAWLPWSVVLLQRFLQAINQFLHVLLGKRLKHPAGQRSNPADNIRLPEPNNLGLSARRGLQVKPRAQARRAAGHFSSAFINGTTRALHLHERHLDGRRSANVRNAYAELHQKIPGVENFHALIIRQQRAKAVRVHEKVVNFLRRFLDREVAVELDLHRLALPHLAGRHADRFENVLVTGATASISRDSFANLLVRRLGVLVQQVNGREKKARRAEAALQPVAFREGLLHWMQRAVRRKALHRSDLSAVGHGGEERTRLDRAAVQKHCAGSAIGGIAANVRAGQVQVVAQEFHEQCSRLDQRLSRLAVHANTHGYFFNARHIRVPPPRFRLGHGAPPCRARASPALLPARAYSPRHRAYRSAVRLLPALLRPRAESPSRRSSCLAAPPPLAWPESPSSRRSPKQCEHLCKRPCHRA